jgi:uncharacterized protein YjdB
MLFILCMNVIYAQPTPVITSVQGKLIRVTPPLSQIDDKTMYGDPLTITRYKDGFAGGVVDPERAEEQIFKHAKKNTDIVLNPSKGFVPSLNAPISVINQNFDGQVFPNFAPSDNNLAVGPNHVIQIINHSSGSAFKIWNKSGGLVQDSKVLSTITGVSGSGDPVILYDQLADRWVLTEFAKVGSVNYINTLVIAVSATANPTGSWNVYSFNVGTFFVDYPKYAVWHNAYYATSNDFNTAGSSYLGSSIYAFDRNAMLAGNASATMIRTRFTGSGSRYYSMAPVCLEGMTSSNQSGLFAFIQDNSWVNNSYADSIYTFEFTPNFVTPANSVVGAFKKLKSTIAFNTNTGNLAQPGTTTTLQALNQRLMNKVIYRNFGSYESIVCNTTDLANGRTGVHWWELRRNGGSGDWSIYQEGVYQPDNDNRFMGSIAINANGDIGLLYNVVSSSTYPSARFTGRSSCDPLGQMTLAEQTVQNGTTFESNNRYGDYNSLSVDPSNGSFWGTAQYNKSNAGTFGNWATRVVNFTLTSSCSGSNPGTVSGTTPLCIGQSTTYSTNGDPGGTWSSSNTAVATVNASSGLVNAVAAGTTNITYTIGGNSSFKTLTVDPNVSAGTVSGTSPLCIGGTSTYTSNGTVGGSWSSSNTAVATVNASTGLITAVGAGTTDIKYTVSSGCGSPVNAIKTLTVNPNVSAGTVSGTSPVCIGATPTYTSNGTTVGSWSSSNTSVATVNASTGVVTAVGAGTTNITYTVNSGCGSPVSNFLTLTVDPNVTAGSISGTSPVCIGATPTFSSNGTSGGTWSSTNPSVATVNASTGVVTAIGTGTTDITYTVNSGCGSPKTNFKTLTVSSEPSPGTVSGTSPLCVGQTASYTSNGDAGGIWSSSNTAVATVNASTGLVTAVAQGTVNIVYTVTACNGDPITSSQSLTVNPLANAGTVSGTTPLCVGQNTTYTSNGDAGGTWSTSNPSVATINAATGQLTALTSGTTTISYVVSNSCGSVTASQSLTVNDVLNPGTVSGASSVCIGSTTTFSSNGDPGGTWSSSNTAIATVNASTGVVTGVAAGTVNITYSVSNGCGTTSSSKPVDVVSCAPTITCPTSISTSTTSGCNKSVTTPDPAVNNATSLTWTMSGATTGSGSGNVGTRNFNIGLTTITYTASNASGTATCSFTVTVTDNTPASITCPANIANQQNGNGKCSATIAVPNPVTSGNCSVSKLSWTMTGALTGSSPVTGINYVGTQTFPVGITNITYTVTNGAGNTATCSFTVTVRNSKCPGSPAAPETGNVTIVNTEGLSVQVFPNPSESYFTLTIQSSKTENVEVSVYTMNGKLVQKLKGNVSETFRFGDNYVAGTYIVKVQQGLKQMTVKVVK